MMNCPICGVRVIAIFHEWHSASNEAYFEYLHSEEGGVRSEPCTIVLPYSEGIERYTQEWNEMQGEELQVH